jgi:hypothetical protein
MPEGLEIAREAILAAKKFVSGQSDTYAKGWHDALKEVEHGIRLRIKELEKNSGSG